MWPECQHDPTGLALLQGCKDHPTETDRSLILADWLEEQGEPEEWIDLPSVVRQHWAPWNRWWTEPQACIG